MESDELRKLQQRQDHNDKTLQVIVFIVAAFIAYLIFR